MDDPSRMPHQENDDQQPGNHCQQGQPRGHFFPLKPEQGRSGDDGDKNRQQKGYQDIHRCTHAGNDHDKGRYGDQDPGGCGFLMRFHHRLRQ